MKKGWFAFDLPGYREYPVATTYGMFPYDELPLVTGLPDDFSWLAQAHAHEGSLADRFPLNDFKCDLEKDFASVTCRLETSLPPAFTSFMHSLEFQSKVRSCTDCYLSMADRAIRTRGATEGYLIHFLSDSQFCSHWYLHVNSLGDHFVAVSPAPYCYNDSDPQSPTYPTCNKEELDLDEEPIWFCSATFTEFVYRFWLENEIWYALQLERRPLTDEEQAYVSHYKSIPSILSPDSIQTDS